MEKRGRLQQVDKIMIILVHGVNLLQEVFQTSIAYPCNTSHGQVASPGVLNAGRARLFIAAPLFVKLLHTDPVILMVEVIDTKDGQVGLSGGLLFNRLPSAILHLGEGTDLNAAERLKNLDCGPWIVVKAPRRYIRPLAAVSGLEVDRSRPRTIALRPITRETNSPRLGANCVEVGHSARMSPNVEVWHRLPGAPLRNRFQGCSKEGHFDSGRVAGCPPPSCCPWLYCSSWKKVIS